MEFLQNPVVQVAIISVIFLSLLAEAKTAGFSGGGLVALVFGMLLAAGYSEEWPSFESVLYIGGLVLILLDVCLFFTGILAFAGLFGLLVALFLLLGSGVSAMVVLLVGIVIAFGLLLLLDKHLSTNPLWRKISLSLSLTSQEGYVSSVEKLDEFTGKTGTAQTVLRPAGKVKIGDAVLDAVTQGDFIREGESVIVVKAESNRIVVKKA